MSSNETSNPTPAAKFAEFLARPEYVEDIELFHCAFGDSGVQFPEGPAALITALGWAGVTDAELFENFRELANKLQDAGESFEKIADAYDARMAGAA